MKAGLYVLSGLFQSFLLLSCGGDSGSGCTDSQANNYNPSATENNGYCTYDHVELSPVNSIPLDELLSETSGLIYWEGYLWTHNDDGPSVLYGLDTASGAIIQTLELGEGENQNWEELTQDEDYFYIGAFGNNASGNRTDLHILRVSKLMAMSGHAELDTIWFSYGDQEDLSSRPPNFTDYDCEAFLVRGDHIFLFTKQWISAGSTLYKLPKSPGTYIAERLESFPVGGMVSGSCQIPGKQVLILCGYSVTLQPFLYLFYDFHNDHFFSGNCRKMDVNLPGYQIECITFTDSLICKITNEQFQNSLLSVPPAFHTLDMGPYLSAYLSSN